MVNHAAISLYTDIAVYCRGLPVIRITDSIWIDERDLAWEFVRSSGPGGQNVNKVATAVRLRFDVKNARGLPRDVRDSILENIPQRITSEGELIINARRFRTQERNRADAINRMKEIILHATVKPATRRETHPPMSSRIKRLQSKHRRSRIKDNRGQVRSRDE